MRRRLNQLAVAASLLWLALVLTAWIGSHAAPSAWRAWPTAGNAVIVPPLPPMTNPPTRAEIEAFRAWSDRHHGRPGERLHAHDPVAWFVENRDGRLVLLGQWLAAGRVGPIDAEGLDAVEVTANAGTPRLLVTNLSLALDLIIEGRPFIEHLPDPVASPTTRWQHLGFFWDRRRGANTGPIKAIGRTEGGGGGWPGISKIHRYAGGPPRADSLQIVLPHWLVPPARPAPANSRPRSVEPHARPTPPRRVPLLRLRPPRDAGRRPLPRVRHRPVRRLARSRGLMGRRSEAPKSS